MKILSIICLFSFYFFGCSNSPTTPSDNPQTEPRYSIYLTGKVTNKDGQPLVGTIAKLKGLGLADTTNSQGIYLIAVKDTSALPKALSAHAAKDTLDFLRDGQVITSLDIINWIDTLPDIFIVQRNISGLLQIDAENIGRIEACLTENDIPNSPLKAAELWYNMATGGYSGFLYFVYTSGVLHYSVYINVYNSTGSFIGRSVTVNFNSIAGDIDIPVFSTENAKPRAFAGPDLAAIINDSISLHGSAADTFGGSITTWEWDINNTGFNKISSGDTLIIAPSAANAHYPCILRVTDNDGNQSSDTCDIRIARGAPVAIAGSDTAVSINDSIFLHGNGTDSAEGSIIAWEWDINNTGFNKVSSGETTLIAPDRPVSTYPCVLRVTDNDGNFAYDSCRVTVLLDAPVAGAGKDTNVLANTTVIFKCVATDAYGHITGYYWDFNGDGTFDDSSAVPRDFLHSYANRGIYNAAFKVTDDDHVSSSDIVRISVLSDTLPVIDGVISPDEWTGYYIGKVASDDNVYYYPNSSVWQGPQTDFNYDLYMRYDNDFVYVAVQVTVDDISVQSTHDSGGFFGDIFVINPGGKARSIWVYNHALTTLGDNPYNSPSSSFMPDNNIFIALTPGSLPVYEFKFRKNLLDPSNGFKLSIGFFDCDTMMNETFLAVGAGYRGNKTDDASNPWDNTDYYPSFSEKGDGTYRMLSP